MRVRTSEHPDDVIALQVIMTCSNLGPQTDIQLESIQPSAIGRFPQSFFADVLVANTDDSVWDLLMILCGTY